MIAACGAELGPAQVAVRRALERARTTNERLRRELAAFSMALGAFDAVFALYEEPVPAQVEPGRTHSFGIDAAIRYLAAGLRAKQPARDLEPAFREIVASFPYTLHLKKLSAASLFAIAYAHHVHGEGRAPSEVAAQLHAHVRASAPVPTTPLHATPPKPTRTEPIPMHGAWARVELRAVEGLWGGHVVHVFADGDFWYEHVERGAKLSRIYRATLPTAGLLALSDLLARHDVRSMTIPDRPGVPGEARVILTAIGNGWAHAASKWSNVRHPDFDALAGWLKQSGEQLSQSAQPRWQGPYEWNWRPA